MLSHALKTHSLPSPTLHRTRSRPLSITNAATAYKQPPGSVSFYTPSTPTSSLYEVLRISAGATCHEIKTAYRKLVRTWHPDVAVADRTAAEEFKRIHAAYSTLSDPEKRAVYDRKMLVSSSRRRSRALTSAAAASGGVCSYGYGGRSWETDQCW